MYLKLPAIKIYDKLTSLRYIFLYQVWLFTRPKFSRKLIKELMFCIQYAFRPAFLRFVQNVWKANAGIFFLVYSACMSFFSLNFPFHEIFFFVLSGFCQVVASAYGRRCVGNENSRCTREKPLVPRVSVR